MRDQKRVMNSAFESVKRRNNYSNLLPIKDTRHSDPHQITANYAITPVALIICDRIVDEIGNSSLGLSPVKRCDLFAVAIQNQQGNRQNLQPTCELGFRLDIDGHDADLFSVSRCKFSQYRVHCLARATPRSPEIHQYGARMAGLDDALVKVISGYGR